MLIQSILIPKNKFTYEEAVEYMNKNEYKIKKVGVTTNYYRFRQYDP